MTAPRLNPGAAVGAQTHSTQEVSVWDPLVRLGHWGLVAAVATAFIAEEGERLHNYAGYVVAGILPIRLLWGFIGARHARFGDFVRGPRAVLDGVKDLLRGAPKPSLGHTPAGGAMILALLGMLGVVAGTGVLLSFDAFWGNEWIEEIHEAAANLLMVFIPIHVLAVIATSWLGRENLIRAMITGRKRAPDAAAP